MARVKGMAGNTAHNTGGSRGHSAQQRPIAGPVSPGPPASMAKALARKPLRSGTGVALVTRGTSAPGAKR